VTLFVLLLDTSSADASFNYSAIATLEDREIESAGLYDLATQARGAVLRVIGSGETAFQRIAREMMGYYLLGFEPEAGDRDGGSHDIKVAVSRPKATVRARGLLSIPAAPPTPRSCPPRRSPLLDRPAHPHRGVRARGRRGRQGPRLMAARVSVDPPSPSACLSGAAGGSRPTGDRAG
jgi:hypothetical protein